MLLTRFWLVQSLSCWGRSSSVLQNASRNNISKLQTRTRHQSTFATFSCSDRTAIFEHLPLDPTPALDSAISMSYSSHHSELHKYGFTRRRIPVYRPFIFRSLAISCAPFYPSALRRQCLGAMHDQASHTSVDEYSSMSHLTASHAPIRS
jgi:hypothetical protein